MGKRAYYIHVYIQVNRSLYSIIVAIHSYPCVIYVSDSNIAGVLITHLTLV